MKKKILAALLSVAMISSLLAGCGGKDGENTGNTDASQGEENTVTATGTYDTLVIGVQDLGGVFSPFFYTSAYDAQVMDMIFSPVARLDKDGEVIDDAGSVSVEEVTAEDGHTQFLYTIKIQEGLSFTDGEPVTIDDMIFNYYVMADPTYDGMSTFSTLDIVGMKEYYYDTADYTQMVKECEDKYSLENISEEDYLAYLIATNLEGWWDGNPAGEVQEGYTWSDYITDEGFGDDLAAIDAANADEMLALLAKVEYTNYASGYDPLSYYQAQMVAGSVDDGIDVPEISGIQKVDEYTCTVLFDSPNISGDKLVAWQSIIPEHYYGASWSKGNLDSIKELNNAPLGCGPYIFESYENNIVTLKANADYFKGAPKIPTIKFQIVNEDDKVDLILSGDIDITDPSAELELVEQLNQNTDKAVYSLVDNPGYGYIAINAERVPDINVRKGLMHLMNREPAVNSYFGELGQVIERTMTPTLAEYPDDATEYYGYNPEKALEYFKAAGYEDVNGKLVKDGEQLRITVGIGEASSHPSTPILTQMANDMAAMGAELVVNDVQFSVLSPMVQGGELDMWVMAWGNSTDCDLTQIFGSRGGSNDHKYYSAEIDALQEQIMQTIDFEERCKLVEQELDLIMDAAVYMPVYQRKNMEVYNANTIKLETLPEETTTYYNYAAQIEKLEMN